MHDDSSVLPYKLKENARRALSLKAGCEFCASFGEPDRDGLDAQGALALEFADRMILDYCTIDEPFIERMRSEFDEQELVEFVAWMCFKFGANMFGAIYEARPGEPGDADRGRGDAPSPTGGRRASSQAPGPRRELAPLLNSGPGSRDARV